MKEYATWKILAICFLCLLLLVFPPVAIRNKFVSESYPIEGELPISISSVLSDTQIFFD